MQLLSRPAPSVNTQAPYRQASRKQVRLVDCVMWLQTCSDDERQAEPYKTLRATVLALIADSLGLLSHCAHVGTQVGIGH